MLIYIFLITVSKIIVFLNYLKMCCSVGLGRPTVGMDYEFANINSSVRNFSFTLYPKATTSFEITIIDDNIAEYWKEHIAIDLFVYGLTGIDPVSGTFINIHDDDGK